MLIADAADRAGVNPQTLRYYERRGLLKLSARRPSGYREYTPNDVNLVRFVKRAQDLGFSLAEVEELLSFRQPRPGQRRAVRRVAERHLEDLAAKIRDLQRMEHVLGHLVQACRSGEHPHCPILEAFEASEEESDDRR